MTKAGGGISGVRVDRVDPAKAARDSGECTIKSGILTLTVLPEMAISVPQTTNSAATDLIISSSNRLAILIFYGLSVGILINTPSSSS